MGNSFLLALVLVFANSPAWANLRLLSAATSGEQDVFRMELQFDQIVDQSKIGIQFVDKAVVLSIPEVDLKKMNPELEAKVKYIQGVKLNPGKDRILGIEIQFSDLTALQMKENLSLEALGKSFIVEVLPPIWNKGLPPPENAVSSSPTPSSTDSVTPKVPPTKPENEIPLFDKKAESSAGSGGAGKIIFTVLSLIGLGGYFIWWMKNKSKMVNGPESLMKIKMVTQFHLGPKKTLAVVRIAGESLLLGVTETQISLIKTLSLLDEDVPDVTTDAFAQVLGKQDVQTPGAKGDATMEMGGDEEFSFGPAVKTSLTQKIPMLRKII